MLELSISEKFMEHVGPDKLSSLLHSSHYANDTIIFYKASTQQFNNVKLILYLYELLIGLKINFVKSYLMGLGLHHQEVQGYAAILGYTTSSFPIKYLGIPFHYNSLPATYWNYVVSMVERRLSGWKRNTLTIAGRLTRINSILRAILGY